MAIRLPTDLKINEVVRTMIAADFLLIAATGFLSPILAVFITTQIEGGTLATAGFAVTIFWVVKSAFQIPISLSADAKKGERDDFMLLMSGVLLAAVVQLLYFFFAREIWHVFLLSALDGFAYSLQVPTYLGIFTRHIDKYRESTEWMLHSNAIGLGFAIAAALGGVLAERFGFRIIFLLSSALLFASAATLLGLRGKLYSGTDDGRSEFAAQRKRPMPQ